MDVRPLADHVVVEVINQETTVAGIVLPDTAKDQLQKARVVAVGSGHLLENGTRAPLEVQNEDVVLFEANRGTKVRVGQNEYLLISEADILAVLSGAPVLA
ncbi:MAG: co-chaperone GroES [Firmicutes bacterium]|jgi:chaperonin GroES|nr:co-chaperone GroES [Bacillota bacterium]